MSQTRALDLEPVFNSAPPATKSAQRAEELIAELSLRLAAVPDTALLTEFARAASDALGADFFVISRLNPFSNIMRSMRFLADGEMVQNISYSLDGTPCARAMEDGVCIYPENVAAQFPRDQFLVEKEISGYAGAAMLDECGRPLGVMLALTRQPIRDADAAGAVLSHFRRRVACAIDSADMIERNEWVVAEATDGTWDWDVVTGGTMISDSLLDLLGHKKRGLFGLATIEEAIHPDDRDQHAAALRAHLNSGAPFNVRIRLKTRDGGWRWFISRGKAIRNEKGRAARMIGCFIDVNDIIAPEGRARAAAEA